MSSAPSLTDAPPLESGDRLSRAEFEARYAARPEWKKAELIEGVVYVSSPVKEIHARPDGLYITWLSTYAARTPPLVALPNATVRLDGDNEPQPDSLLYLPGRSARVDADGYVAGAPELVVEVANSSVSYDLHDKRRAYQRNGVGTYVVHVVREREIRWFELVAGAYDELAPDADGVFRSRAFPGLWLDAHGASRADLARALDVLALGLASTEHAAFAGSLRSVGT